MKNLASLAVFNNDLMMILDKDSFWGHPVDRIPYTILYRRYYSSGVIQCVRAKKDGLQVGLYHDR